MGVGRAPPDTVAQQRITELGVAAPDPFARRGPDGADTRRRDAGATPADPGTISPVTCARTPRHPPCLRCIGAARADGRGSSCCIGFNSRLAHVTSLTRAGRRLSIISETDALVEKPGTRALTHLLENCGGGWGVGSFG